MGSAGRSAPLRRTGSLLGLLGLEVAAVLALHWLGSFAELRIGWDEPVPWLLSSPVQAVLGALLRTVALVMAYWLLASTLVYLLASLTRLPAAVRAVRWATLPFVRRVADHAMAVTLATSMVGGGGLGMAAQDAPTAPAGQATETSEPNYFPEAAEQAPAPDADDTTSTSTSTSTTAPEATTTAPTTTAPTTTTRGSTTTTQEPATTTTTPETTTTTGATTTTIGPTTTTAPETTTTGGAARSAPSYVPSPAGRPAEPTTTNPPNGPSTTAGSAGATSTTRPQPPAYVPIPASPAPTPSARESAGGGGGASGSTGSEESSGGDEAREERQGSGQQRERSGQQREGSGQQREQRTHVVKPGDNLWAIARDHLRGAGGGSGEPTNRQVAEYWLRVVEANQDGLQSRDPDLIYPDEEITLPPVG